MKARAGVMDEAVVAEVVGEEPPVLPELAGVVPAGPVTTAGVATT